VFQYLCKYVQSPLCDLLICLKILSALDVTIVHVLLFVGVGGGGGQAIILCCGVVCSRVYLIGFYDF
jgi:hypothetical protein